MPGSVLELLPQETRLDMLDYFDAATEYNATNDLRGNSRLNELTDDYLEVEVTPVSTLQLKVMPDRKGRRMVVANYIVGEEGDTQESTLYFFDSSMKPLPAEAHIKTPKLSDFFNLKDRPLKMKEIEAMIPYYSVVYNLDSASGELTGRLTLEKIVTVEVMDTLRPLLREVKIAIK